MSREELERLVRVWIVRLGLDRWQIRIIWDASEFQGEEPHARTWRARDYDEARIYLNPTTSAEWSRDEAERHIVHELLHLVTREAEFVLDLLEGRFSSSEAELVERVHSHAIEGIVDRLAAILVELGVFRLDAESRSV